uniref:Uncharacterized protein n=1 Tax=Anopheles atroparvus TaxID=41427 RepID=A0A182J4Q5_ANOAO
MKTRKRLKPSRRQKFDFYLAYRYLFVGGAVDTKASSANETRLIRYLAGNEDLSRFETNTGVYADVLVAAVGSVHDQVLLEDEVAQVGGLVAERVGRESVGERDEPVRKVVLAEPGEHALLLHVGPASDVNEQVAELLPVARNVDGASAHLRVLTGHRYGRGKRTVDAEHDALGLGWHHRQVEVNGRVVSSHNHLDREDSVAAGAILGQDVRDTAVLVRCLGREQLPLASRRIAHQRNDIKRAIHKARQQPLRLALAHDHVVRAMVGRHVLQLDRGALLVPLLARLRRLKPGRTVSLAVSEPVPVDDSRRLVYSANLLQDERGNVGRLPVAGVEQMRKRMRREVGQTFRAVERVIEALRAPPALLQLVDRRQRRGLDWISSSKWHGWPLPSGYLAYLGILMGGRSEKRALSIGSSRAAVGSAGLPLPLHPERRRAERITASGLPKQKNSPTSNSNRGWRDSLVDDERRRRGEGALSSREASRTPPEQRQSASCANTLPIESPMSITCPPNPRPSSERRNSAVLEVGRAGRQQRDRADRHVYQVGNVCTRWPRVERVRTETGEDAERIRTNSRASNESQRNVPHQGRVVLAHH